MIPKNQQKVHSDVFNLTVNINSSLKANFLFQSDSSSWTIMEQALGVLKQYFLYLQMVVLNGTNNHVNLLTKSSLTGDAAVIKHWTGFSCFAFTNPVSFGAIYSEYSGGIFFLTWGLRRVFLLCIWSVPPEILFFHLTGRWGLVTVPWKIAYF